VKEVSLLDQGSQGKQSVYQLEQVRQAYTLFWCNILVLSTDILYKLDNILGLESLSCSIFLFLPRFYFLIQCCFFQEIDLLSQFEHENIVQYYGTAKVPYFFHVFSVLNNKIAITVHYIMHL
jgi:hypothetical protein